MDVALYGECSCGTSLIPVFFIEEERNRNNVKTGRKRRAISCLVCPTCLKNFCIDDSFDEKWR